MPAKSQISTIYFDTIKSDLKKGTLKLPQFQRELVWPLKKSATLLDSILRGYPIGSIILWKTTERFDDIRDIGGVDYFQEAPKDIQIDYIIDGQQRITSLYAILEGITIKKTDYSEVYVDLEVDPEVNDDKPIVVLENEKEKEDESEEYKRYIKLHDLLEDKRIVTDQYSENKQDRITSYGRKISSFPLPAIYLLEAGIDIVVEAFTRLNTGGKPLGIFEIMVARTYDAKRNFDLAKKYTALSKKLGDWKISNSTILQVVSALLETNCSKKKVLLLEKDDFISTWDGAVDAIERTIDFFKKNYQIPVSKLLPYDGLIVLFAYYFFHQRNDKGKKITTPTKKDADNLKELFWRVSLGERYSSATETKITQDLKKINIIIAGDRPKYEWEVDTSPKRIITDGYWSINKSFVKAILVIYAAKKPKCFKTGSDVILDNSYLKQANSKNYHHFFPTKFLEDNGKEDSYINHILNITIIDESLNKGDIGARAPSDYLSEFKKENAKIKEHLKTHLIDLDKDGVLNDEYDTFFNNRAERVSKELEKLIIPD